MPAQVLQVMIPLYKRLGPLLNTMGNMLLEVLAFVLPFFMVTAAFATALNAVFGPFAASGIETVAQFGKFG